MSSVGKNIPVNDYYAFLCMAGLFAVGLLIWLGIVPWALNVIYDVPYRNSRFIFMTLWMSALASFVGVIALGVYWPRPHPKNH